MYWLVAGLFLIGAVCGAAIRLMAFIVVLLGAAGIAIAAFVSHGLGAAVLDAVIAVVMLQIGYAAGFVLRAVWRSRQVSGPPQLERKPPVHVPLGEKRR
jgi:hypothetical protein